ncbi:trans-sulfuration enzyme family protein [Rossellomorea marisflavi]|uniref:trans-sulfuration enzyme family protein n=1 Tax=Rossellomorea marisflavi TaxID=189381 RepID=UPI001C43C6ED|nr:aminotransferase class I/II-fold pyridoxal phosphate-dependent enzyme [Rossellomorea marisflavi]MBV6684128.1 aminotransferase class I/II-fold pyridoxal phosphate-dependent enzyme [Bacillus sp. JRC01]UKS64777.1 aminotransferase class I/II-fold pyridoxal phosphate-dependent enzyme [Rossellomorea marisflavi]
MNFTTKVVHSQLKGTEEIKSKTTPIYQTSAFSFSSLEELEGFYEGKSPYLYTRTGNPNPDELGGLVAALEGAPAGVAASSGLSAILVGILSVVQAGDHIIAAEDLYGGTFHMLKEELAGFGISTSFVDFTDRDAVEAAITDSTKLLYSETVTNPFMRVEDIPAMVELAKEHGLTTMIDNTFATPFLRKPFTEGIDIVAHSATKYIGGHSDVTAGVVTGRQDLVDKARAKIVNLGANLSPFEAWLTCRGAKTLALRMERQALNAELLAVELRRHEWVKRVYYPNNLSEKGHGAIVTIELEPSADMSTFFKSLGWIKIIPSLAGVETTVSYPLGTSHRSLPEEAQKKLGINTHVVRISLGIEDPEDIKSQMLSAISKCHEI